MDLFFRKVVGWCLDEHMSEALILESLPPPSAASSRRQVSSTTVTEAANTPATAIEPYSVALPCVKT